MAKDRRESDTAMLSSRRPYSLIVVAGIGIFLLMNILSAHLWTHRKIIESDTFSYYAYLPAAVYRHDLTLSFLDWDRQTPFNDMWYSTSENGMRFTKMTYGWAAMQAPFFFMADLAARIGQFPVDGFSIPYKIAICIAAWFYTCLALVLLRRLLVRYFSEAVTAITLLLLVFGTNLYHYTVYEPGMTHPLNFFLFASFALLTAKWYEKASVRNAMLLGLVTGLIAVTRASNLVIVVVFLLFGIRSIREIAPRIRLYLERWNYLAVVVLFAGLVLLPQLLYWHTVSGHYIFYAYLDEHFFFSRPHILAGLLGFRKGWLLYTPVMAVALLALAGLSRSNEWKTGLLVFVVLNVYVVLSWWCWWYGGSFGARAFIESYALMSLPLASAVRWALRHGILPAALGAAAFVFLNVYQTFQYKKGRIHYDAMTQKAYTAVFLRDATPPDWESLICHPDYYNAKLGIRERTDCTGHDHNNP